MDKKTYIAIDLKSFYASVECMERGLDPLNTNLVVADDKKTEKTICLAVSPSLKAYGISGRARLYEVIQRVKKVNEDRRKILGTREFSGSSFTDDELKKDPSLELDYIIAPPRMSFYIEYSTKIVDIYLKYISKEDMHIYSIDEVFMDVTNYLKTYKMTARDLAKTIIQDVYKSTGITATAGIGDNLYLCKVAMDIGAKHIKSDEDGVRIAHLDEKKYRKYMWEHKPITDFWRVGKGYAKRLAKVGIYTMGDIAKCSIGRPEDFYNEDLLYNIFGVNAELLIDHAWGYEPVTIKDIKSYRPDHESLASGQVLTRPYSFEEGRLILKEMADKLSLDLFAKGLTTNQLVLTIGYDVENVDRNYKGELVKDGYGRLLPKKSSGTINLPQRTNSGLLLKKMLLEWYDHHANRSLTIRRFNIFANFILNDYDKDSRDEEQLSLFDQVEAYAYDKNKEGIDYAKEKRLQEATLEIKRRFGKNAILKGMNFEEAATTRIRNDSIGGHKA